VSWGPGWYPVEYIPIAAMLRAMTTAKMPAWENRSVSAAAKAGLVQENGFLFPGKPRPLLRALPR